MPDPKIFFAVNTNTQRPNFGKYFK